MPPLYYVLKIYKYIYIRYEYIESAYTFLIKTMILKYDTHHIYRITRNTNNHIQINIDNTKHLPYAIGVLWQSPRTQFEHHFNSFWVPRQWHSHLLTNTMRCFYLKNRNCVGLSFALPKDFVKTKLRITYKNVHAMPDHTTYQNGANETSVQSSVFKGQWNGEQAVSQRSLDHVYRGISFTYRIG